MTAPRSDLRPRLLLAAGLARRVRAPLAVLLLLACASSTLAQPGPFRRLRSDDKATGFKENPKMVAAFHNVVARPRLSVVRVRSAGKDAALGTVVAADGWILTKNSELAPGLSPVVVLKDGRVLTATVVGVEPKYDLAMLKVDAKDLIPVQWGESKSAAVGDLLASPGTGEEAVAVGVLSVAARSVKVRDLPPSTPPANSGFLGVGLDEAEGGARIVQIVADSAAFKAGLQENDIVTAIADTPIIDSETMVNTIQHHKPGDTVDIKLKRGQQEMALRVTLQKRTPEQMQRRDYQNTLGSELSDRRGGFPQVLQHDMVLRPSDCGGPVVDLDGKAVGINIARAGRVESYAIPAEAVRGLIQDLQSGKLAPPKDAPPTTRPTTRPATTAPSK